MKKKLVALTLFIALAIASVYIYLNFIPKSSNPEVKLINAQEAIDTIYALEALAPRLAGTDQEVQAAHFIESLFKAYGLSPKILPFEFTETDETTKETKTYRSANIVASIAGKSDKQIIIGAHYDSVDQGKGADDNASGVAVMLETARRMTLPNVEPYYSLVFVAFGSEEVGLKGSEAYVSNMTQDEIENTIVMINLDSLIAGDDMNVYGDFGPDGQYRDLALDYARANNIALTTNVGNSPDLPKGTTGDWSDHAPFKAAGIQHVYFEGTNWNLGAKDGYTQVSLEYGVAGEIWHTDFDNLEYINETFPGRAVEHLDSFVNLVYYLALYVPQ